MHGSPVKAEAAVSASKPTERGAVSDARETLRAVGATGQGVRVLGSGGGHGKERNDTLVASNRRARGEGQEKENGWGSGVRRRVEGKTEEGSDSVRGRVDDVGWHGTNTAASSCSDNSGRRTPHGSGGRVLRTGEDGGVRDAERRG
jgi:hypothetical protein